jgi:ribosomal protein L11 methyltransferase
MNPDITWVEISVKTRPEFVEPISELFSTYGGGDIVVEIEGGHSPDEDELPPKPDWILIKTYIRKDSTYLTKHGAIQAGISLFSQVGELRSLRFVELIEDEWKQAYKRYIEPINIGNRIAVIPSWVTEFNSGLRHVIRLDPGMAFGTGHHPTTKMCLELIEKLMKPNSVVLDLGCGSAILSIAAAKLGAKSVTGLDIDDQAIKAARENVVNNNASAVVDISLGSLDDLREGAKYQLLIANISTTVIIKLLRLIESYLDINGIAILSGVVIGRKDEVSNKIKAAGCKIMEEVVNDEWICFAVCRDC